MHRGVSRSSPNRALIRRPWMPPEPSYLVGGFGALENKIDNLDNLETLRFVLHRSWVGYPSRRPKGCGMQSPSGPKVYPKERGSPVVFFFFPQPRLFIFWRGALLSGWRRPGDWWVWAPFKGLPCTLDSWRYSRRSGKGKRCVTQGLPSHGCILLITLGVGGIVCDIADEGVSQVVLTRLNLAQGNCHRD